MNRPTTIYRQCFRASIQQNLAILLCALPMHLYLLGFTVLPDTVLARGFAVCAAFLLFSWMHRLYCLSHGDSAALRWWYFDCIFSSAFPLLLYLCILPARPLLSLLGGVVLLWQNHAMLRSVRTAARHFIGKRLGRQRLNISPAESIPHHLNSWCLTSAAALTIMMVYNGGRPYTSSPAALSEWARWCFTAIALCFLWARCLFALHRLFSSAPSNGRLRFLLQHMSWPFWCLFPTAGLLGTVICQSNDAWIIPLALAHLLCGCLFLHYAGGRPSKLWGWMLAHPPHLLVVSFVILISLGGYLLSLPCCDAQGSGLALPDAIFTATSAVCVTGLSVIDIGTRLTGTGQTVLAVLIQLGSLGIMTVGSFIALSFGHRIGLLESSALQDMTGEERGAMAKRLIRLVITLTLTVETLGTAAMTLWFIHADTFGDNALAFKHGAFLTLNAFCNSGFSLLPDNCISFHHEIPPMLMLTVLITIGGLGYHVLACLWNRLLTPRPLPLSPHVKLVLAVSTVLSLSGTILMFIGEYNHSMRSLPWDESLANSLFQAASCRTAGFNSVEVAELTPFTLLYSIFQMFCGGAPGSNAGGIRVTAIGVLVMLVYSMMRGRRDVVIFKSTVSEQTIRQAMAVLLTCLFCVGISTLALSAHFPHEPLLDIIFEAVSAIGTVGMSMGLTARLDLFGKIVIICLMLIGRVGFLTLLAMMRIRPHNARVRYPVSRIVIG